MKDFSLVDENVVITSDHEVIKNWIIRKGGSPAVFDDPEARGDKLSIRIDFPGKMDERYMNEAVKTRQVSWDKFFDIFDKKNLAFAYDIRDDIKDVTLAYKFVPRKRLPKK